GARRWGRRRGKTRASSPRPWPPPQLCEPRRRGAVDGRRDAACLALVHVVLGHSGGGVAPDSSDPPASGANGEDAAVKPATELFSPGVTGRRRAAALAGHTGDAP